MKRCLFIISAVTLLISLAACRSGDGIVMHPEITENSMGNLAKTARVWGFAMFTHEAFLSGERCWDEELLGLLPRVFIAGEQETNDILHEWFVGLGDPGWELTAERLNEFLGVISAYDELLPLRTRLAGETNVDWAKFHEIVGEYIGGMETDALANFIFEGSNPFILLQYVESTVMPNQAWRHDASYLGVPLSNLLAGFSGIPVFTEERLANAPIFLNPYGPSFDNMPSIRDMNFGDWRYRLLGLFRVWNTVNYFFPYLDLMEQDWNSLIYKYSAEMLAGHCRDSYMLTLARMTSHMRENYLMFKTIPWQWWRPTFLRMALDERFGDLRLPVTLINIDGSIVVERRIPGWRSELEAGDIILRMDGVCVHEILDERMSYFPASSKQQILMMPFAYRLLTTFEPYAELDIIRDGSEMSLTTAAVTTQYPWARFTPDADLRDFVVLPENLALLPGGLPRPERVSPTMESVRDAYGIIIDLRVTTGFGLTELSRYLPPHDEPANMTMHPSFTVPGTFGFGVPSTISNREQVSYVYTAPIVLLINGYTSLSREQVAMALRHFENVTLIGSNSRGSNGTFIVLPVPGGFYMQFLIYGMLAADGSQVQRVGIAPDIRVERTIEGIREGRDEYLEAAIEFILSNRR